MFEEVDFAGKKVLITAGADGLGLEMAQVFHRAGASVLVCDVNRERLAALPAELPGVRAVHADVSDEDSVAALFDADSTTEIGARLGPTDLLKFKDQKKYSERIKIAQKNTGEYDALIAMRGLLKGRALVASSFDFAFMGGSMGSVVGERFALAAETAVEIGAPYVCFSQSGGARMQEGLFSLMQMAKTSAALGKLREAGLPYISVLTHPTTGGVSASFAMLGDINIAEPQALIGFAGPRVIEQTVREKLPEGFQRSEFLLEHGAIDQICDRREMRDRLSDLLAMLGRQPAPEVA